MAYAYYEDRKGRHWGCPVHSHEQAIALLRKMSKGRIEKNGEVIGEAYPCDYADDRRVKYIWWLDNEALLPAPNCSKP